MKRGSKPNAFAAADLNELKISEMLISMKVDPKKKKRKDEGR